MCWAVWHILKTTVLKTDFTCCVHFTITDHNSCQSLPRPITLTAILSEDNKSILLTKEVLN